MSTDRPTSTTDHDKEADRPPVDHEPMTINNAARRLGISQNAVLQRAKRGTLYSEVIDGKRMVWVPPGGRSVGTKKTTDQTAATTKNAPTDQTETAALAGIVDRLVRENREAWSMAAVWQERANVLQERILALEAGAAATPTPPETAPIPTEPLRTFGEDFEINNYRLPDHLLPVAPPAAGRPWFGARLARRIRGD